MASLTCCPSAGTRNSKDMEKKAKRVPFDASENSELSCFVLFLEGCFFRVLMLARILLFTLFSTEGQRRPLSAQRHRSMGDSPNKRQRTMSLEAKTGDLATEPQLLAGLEVTLVPTGREPVKLVTDSMNYHFSYNIGNSLWGASLELVKFLEENDIQDGTSAIEVGAGCGALGLAAWKRGFSCVSLTDLEEMLPIMKENIRFNGAETAVEARPVDWSDGGESAREVFAARGPFDLIVGAEVTYDSRLHAGLVESLAILCGAGAETKHPSTGPRPRVIIAIPRRDDDEDIVAVARAKGFTVTELKVCPASKDHSSDVILMQFVPPSTGTWAELPVLSSQAAG